MSNTKRYIDVILPLPVKGTFTYCTNEADLLIGQRVVVQFGVRKLYSAVVKSIHKDRPVAYEPKPLLAILDEDPVVNLKQLTFWDWIADYYMCNLGDVMNAAMPTLFKLASESKIIIHHDFDGDIDHLSTAAHNILNLLLDHKELNINQLIKLTNSKNIFSSINNLIRKEIVQIKEELHEKYKKKDLKIVKFIRSSLDVNDKKFTKKQATVIKSYLEIDSQLRNKRWIVSELLKKIGASRSIFNALVNKGVFIIEKESVSRLLESNQQLIESKPLVNFQKKALNEIKESFKKKDVCLLHGVTSSGKTELYIKLIEEQLRIGKQVLYLLPEIALTIQIIKRLKQHFGNQVGIIHSHLNNAERLEIWQAVQQKENALVQYPIMLGARSSLFLPFDNLGLIIIDEEHDTSFKQQQPAPRYHARDAAIYLANLHGSKVLLGSATPSLETYYNAKKNKYALVKMHNRFKDIALPKIKIIDIRKVYLKKKMIYQFSPDMLHAIEDTLENRKQVILFQNRRGYSPALSCQNCAYTPNCNNCDVSLTHHKWNTQLKCHYCGYTEKIPQCCPSCNTQDFSDKGYGTEQIEESLKQLFPDNVTRRMDYDTTRGKNSHQKIITDFEEGKIDILVGTQMIAKGLDFDNVAMVGILNADSMLHFPDFRSHERAFQLMLQVAGRAGRKEKQGSVLIQTFNDNHEILKLLKENDFASFIKKEAAERRLFKYPPYNRLIGITLKHKDKRKLDEAAHQFAIIMRKSFGERVLGPEYPFISRIRNFYNKNILLKIEQESSISNAKIIINNIIEKMHNHTTFRSVRIIIDVDPV